MPVLPIRIISVSYTHLLSAAKRRGINIEDFFLENFVTRYEYEMLKNKYEKVKKYSKLNDFLRNIKHKFGLIK